MISFRGYASSHIGLKKPVNEDNYLVGTEIGIPSNLLRQQGVLCAVADGMSGHAAGKIASEIAIATLKEFYNQPYLRVSPLEGLETLFRNAHRKISTMARDNPLYKGMGTTLTAIVLKENQLCYGHVGDSRLYLITGDTGSTQQITRDHTLIAKYLQEGKLSAQEALDEDDNVLEQALGFNREIRIDLGQLEIRPGDYLILTTDGLTKSLPSSKIKMVILNSQNPEDACKKLIRRATENGRTDDITVIVIEVMGS